MHYVMESTIYTLLVTNSKTTIINNVTYIGRLNNTKIYFSYMYKSYSRTMQVKSYFHQKNMYLFLNCEVCSLTMKVPKSPLDGP